MLSSCRRSLLFLIFIAGVVPFIGSLGHGLLSWDDAHYVTTNPDIQHVSLSNLARIFTGTYVNNYAPLHLLSYMLDHAIWGLNPFGYHLMNCLLHGVNAALVYMIILRIVGRAAPAVWGSLLFAVHPLQVETVAWVAERKSLLAGAFFFWSFLAFIRFSESGNRKDYSVAMIAFILSSLAKVSAIAAPLVFGLYLFIMKSAPLRTTLKRVWPFAGGSVIFAALAVWAQMPPGGFGIMLHGGSISSNALTALVVVIEYGKIFLFPLRLSAYYWFSYDSIMEPIVLVSLLLTVSIAAWILALVRQRREAGFWAAWTFLLFLPNLHIVPLAIVMADRYWYLPLIGPAVLFGRIAAGRGENQSEGEKWWRWTLGFIVLAVFSLLTVARVPVWKSNRTLWLDALSKTPSTIGYVSLGEDFGRAQDWDSASKCHKAALRLVPDFWLAHLNLAWIAGRKGNRAEAESHLKVVLAQAPALNLNNQEMIAEVYASLGRRLESISRYKTILERDENRVEALNNLALLYANGEDPAERAQAVTLAERALGLDPKNATVRATDAWANSQAGNVARAKVLYSDLVSEYPDSLPYLNNLAVAYSSSEDPAERGKAVEYAERAGKLAPANPDVLDTLAWAYYRAGDIGNAKKVMDRALRLPGGNAFQWLHAARIEASLGNKGSAGRYLREYMNRVPEKSRDPEAAALGRALLTRQ